jgi:hypothetical protein
MPKCFGTRSTEIVFAHPISIKEDSLQYLTVVFSEEASSQTLNIPPYCTTVHPLTQAQSQTLIIWKVF